MCRIDVPMDQDHGNGSLHKRKSKDLKGAAYLIQYMAGRIRKKVGMLTVNMR
jgi:hypothetical protein